jgi:tRNA(fMet)-specific endonuclease VapC
MMYFLDTNICVHYLNATSLPLIDKIDSIALERIAIPSVVAAELYYGAVKSAKREYNLSRYNDFLTIFDIVTFDHATARVYGDIRVALEKKGQSIGGNDLMIAASALANDAVLVTNNTGEFSRVDGLAVEDWTQ